MSNGDSEDPLSKTTARLSISQVGADGVDAADARLQVAEFLRSTRHERRDSVVSFEDEPTPAGGSSGSSTNSSSMNGVAPQILVPESNAAKRRRSSVQTIVQAKKVPKKAHKKKMEKISQPPQYHIVENYKDGLINVTVPQLRDVVLFTLTPFSPMLPKWVQVINKTAVKKAVVVIVPGLVGADFFEESVPEPEQKEESVTETKLSDAPTDDTPKTENGTSTAAAIASATPAKYIPLDTLPSTPQLSFFHKNFKYLMRTSAPGTKDSLYLTYHALTHVPFTPKEKKKLMQDGKEKKLTLWDLLLDGEKMKRGGYPIHKDTVTKATTGDDVESNATDVPTLKVVDATAQETKTVPELEGSNEEPSTVTSVSVTLGPGSKFSEYLPTTDFSHEGSHTFALDCEFCQASSGKVLTRISLINFQNEVVLDKFVQPSEPIIDYVTKYSGITPELLEGVTTTLEDIQKEFLSIVSTEDILIGHSLESDLNVLKISHPRIIDTALLFEHPRGPPAKPSLRWLADKYLKRSIQQGESDGSGHSSVEDATACMDLVKLKLQEGACFGINMTEMSIFERLNKSVGQSDQPLKSLVIDSSPVLEWFEQQTPEEKHYVTKKQACNDDEVVSILEKELPDHSLAIIKLRELELYRGWSPIPKDYTGVINTDEQEETVISNLNAHLEQIYLLLPAGTALVVCTAHGNPLEMIRLQGIRRLFQNLERSGASLSDIPPEESWDFEKSLKLQEAATTARQALSFICIKSGDLVPSTSTSRDGTASPDGSSIQSNV